MNRSPAITFILVTVLLDVMGIGLLIPVLPALVGEFTVSAEAQTYWYGAMVMTFATAQFLCAPLLGALSDRYGRRPVLLLAIAGLGSMFLLSAFVRSIEALVALRIVGGALAANFSVANAYVADVTAHEQRAKSFGLIGAAFGIGFIVGPMAGGLLGHADIRLPFYAAGALAFANFLYGLIVLPESLSRERRRPVDWKKANPLGALVGLTRLRAIGPLVAVIALTTLAQFILHTTWVLYTHFRFGWGPREAGLSLFVVGITTAIVQGGLLGLLLKHLGERRVVVVGLASGTLAFAAYGLATQGWMMYAIIAANFLAMAVGAALTGIVSKAADPHEQGLAMGSLASLSSLISIVAPLAGTTLLAEVSHLPATDWRVGAPFFLASTLNFAALVVAAWHFARARAGVAPHVVETTLR